MQKVFVGFNMPSQTFMSERFFATRSTCVGSRGASFFWGAFPLLNKGLDFSVKCQCQDTVPPAVNVLAVRVMPRCQALAISKETNNNKQAEEWTRDSHMSVRQKEKRKLQCIAFIILHNSFVLFLPLS